MTADRELEGQVAIVTGAARPHGIGAAIGERLAAHGATVLLTDVLDDEGEQTARSIDGARYSHLDVTAEDDWKRVVSQVIEAHGRLDVAVLNAGVVAPAQLVNAKLEDWHRVIAVNQTGVFLGMRTTAQAMIESGRGGSIINISSIAATGAMTGSMAYSASKWAVRGMTKVAAKELGRHKIRVNSIHPGWIQTDMLGLVADEPTHAKIQHATPLDRLGTPTDIADTALHLASNASRFVTGQEFIIDGGWQI